MERVDYHHLGLRVPALLAEDGWKCLYPTNEKGSGRLQMLYVLEGDGTVEEIPARRLSLYVNEACNLAVIRSVGRKRSYDIKLPANSVIGAHTVPKRVRFYNENC